jgi:hypothetical protein
MIQKKVLVAIIGAVAIILAALITVGVREASSPGATSNVENSGNVSNHQGDQILQLNAQPATENISIVVVDHATGAPIPGAVITVIGSNGKVVLQNQSATAGRHELRALERDDYTVRARADNYEAAEQLFNLHTVPWEIRLKFMPSPLTPLPFAGWTQWGELAPSPRFNTVTLNGSFADDTAGYVTTSLKALSGKKLILEITGTANSSFYNGQLLKLETANNITLQPEDMPVVIEDGYIPVFDGRVTFAIPDSFNGRLNIVFYKATLRDLHITAYYQ